MSDRYRRIPIEVEAMQLTRDNIAAISEWLPCRITPARLSGPGRGTHDGAVIRTLDMEERAEWGDYVILIDHSKFKLSPRAEFETEFQAIGATITEYGVAARGMLHIVVGARTAHQQARYLEGVAVTRTYALDRDGAPAAPSVPWTLLTEGDKGAGDGE
ncbi:hypothetical protein [Nocardia sp. CA-290969]|uniref:hypothetical protein n=1 Tax=Nocardia sp. CA-290969 TaxID=3239986 RepID=UPI003D94FD37